MKERLQLVKVFEFLLFSLPLLAVFSLGIGCSQKQPPTTHPDDSNSERVNWISISKSGTQLRATIWIEGSPYTEATWAWSDYSDYTPNFSWKDVAPYALDDYVVRYDAPYESREDEPDLWTFEPSRITTEGTYRYWASFNVTTDTTDYSARGDSGIYLFRASNVMNYPTGWGNGIVDTASTYVRVPYVYGQHRNQYNQWVVKGLHTGYDGIDCSGLASWTYLRNDIEVNPNYLDNSSKVNNTNAHMLWQRFGAIANGYDDQEWDQAQDGDLIFFDSDYNDIVDHVGIFYRSGDQKYLIHAFGYDNMVVDDLIPQWLEDYFVDIGAKRYHDNPQN